MKLKKQIILYSLILIIEISFNSLFSQTVQPKPTRQSSFEAFSKGNYEKAYTEFRELLLTYSKDPLYMYYSGVCLVKLKKDADEAINLLEQALHGAGAVKTLPEDGLFYLGRAQQLSGKFTEAEASYKLFTEEVGRKTAKEMDVPGFIGECQRKEGQVAVSEIKPVVKLSVVKPDTIKEEAKAVVRDPVQKVVEKETVSKEALPANYEKILGEAVEYQFKADSVSTVVSEQKKQLEKLSGTEKTNLIAKIQANEKTAAGFQSKADQKYHEAQPAMNPGRDSILHRDESKVQTEYRNINEPAKKTDTKVVRPADKISDTDSAVIPSGKNRVEVFTFFEVVATPVTDPKAKIVIDPEVPPGLIYRIQIAVFRNPVLPAFFKGITPVYGFKMEGTDKTSYYAGMFRKSSDAKKALASVKSKGFRDAFIVALSGNKRVSPDRAVLLEKEWGMKPFYYIEKAYSETPADTITPTLTFRVEVIRSSKPLTEDVVEGIRKIAGNRGLDIQLLADGKIDYLVGKFITFETASEYADLLARNGYREAQVVAWLGKKEIPIETARQLFDQLK